MFLPHPSVKVSIVGSLRDREVACSASDRQGSNFESCVWKTVSSQSSHHPQEVLLAQFSLYVHKGCLKPDSFHFEMNLKIKNDGIHPDVILCHVSDWSSMGACYYLSILHFVSVLAGVLLRFGILAMHVSTRFNVYKKLFDQHKLCYMLYIYFTKYKKVQVIVLLNKAARYILLFYIALCIVCFMLYKRGVQATECIRLSTAGYLAGHQSPGFHQDWTQWVTGRPTSIDRQPCQTN